MKSGNQMNNFTTILWDVDGTLLDFLYSQNLSIRKCFDIFEHEIDDEMISRYSKINDEYWKKHELGLITKQELLTGRFLSFFDEYNIRDIDVYEFVSKYENNLGNVYKYMEDSFDIVKKLKGRVKQYTVTNGVSAVQRNKMHLSKLDTLMDDMFISEEVGAPKPAREFFDYCFEHIDEKDKSKILIIGDSLSSDIKGGYNAGIKTCWFRSANAINNSGIVPDYEIEHLVEIFDII